MTEGIFGSGGRWRSWHRRGHFLPLALRLALVPVGLSALVACTTTPPKLPPSAAPPAPQLVEPEAPTFSETGIASWYGRAQQGRPTADGEHYDMNGLTAAHPSLPFGTILRVTNLANGRSVKVRINDRGPSTPGRIVDLSTRAARALDMVEEGAVRVKLEVFGSDQKSSP